MMLVLLCPFVSAATYWVATTGSDSNSGTQSAPFQHISKAAATAKQPGDTVIVMNGTYGNEGVVEPNFVVTLQYSGTAGSPITFMAQNRGQAILDSQNTSTTTTCNGAASYFNLYNASYIVIQGFVLQNSCDSGFQSNDSAHDITIRWNEIRNIANRSVTDQIGRDGIYLNTSEYNFTFDGNIFHDIGRTGGISQLHFDHGIYAHARSVTIINNIFYNMRSGWSIQLADGAANWLIANNTFAFPNTGDGESGQIMFWGGNSGITMENNIFYEPNSSALTQYAATISGSAFSSNLIYGASSVMSGSTAGITVGANQIGANPLFVNPTSVPPNFQVQAGSPAIAAGVPLSAVVNDITGNTRPATPDLGAYQSVPSAPAPVISGVFTSGVSTNSAFINWSTDESATSYVQYGLSSYTSTTSTNSTLVTTHSVALSNLAASTTYHFRAGSANSGGSATLSSDYTFTTAAAPVPTTISLSATSPAISVADGTSVKDNITATLVSGSAIPVSFSASGLPGGVSASFSPSTCTATCTTTLTLSTTTAVAAGAYSITVTGAGGAPSVTTMIALAITAPPPPLGDITTGLAARWKMTEGTGSYAYDSSGHGNTATLYNPTWWNSDYGTTVWFSGSNSYGSVNENASLEMNDQLTVSFWLRPSQNSNTDPRVISKLYDWDVKLNGAGRYPQLDVGGNFATLNYSLPLITWHHVVFTFSAGVVVGYVDGVQVPFLANTLTGTKTLPQWAYGLNVATDPGNANPYIGSLDDVRIYNRALSAADVAALYAAKP